MNAKTISNKLSMDARAIVAALMERKAQHVPCVWEREMKTRKECKAKVTKRTEAYVRAGIDYANLASVKSGIASGERDEVQALPWGEWIQFPFIIGHKDREYVRVYPATFENLQKKISVQYFIDGREVSKADVEPLCLASEFREREEETLCFTLKAESILAIG
jgi:hypothetical protein